MGSLSVHWVPPEGQDSVCTSLCRFNSMPFTLKQKYASLVRKRDDVWILSCFSRVQLGATPWTVVHQDPLSMGFSRQKYWSELPCPPPRDLPDSETEPMPLALKQKYHFSGKKKMTVSDFCAEILRKCCLGKSLEAHHYQHFPLSYSVILSNHKSPCPWATERSVKCGQAGLPGDALPLGQ